MTSNKMWSSCSVPLVGESCTRESWAVAMFAFHGTSISEVTQHGVLMERDESHLGAERLHRETILQLYVQSLLRCLNSAVAGSSQEDKFLPWAKTFPSPPLYLFLCEPFACTPIHAQTGLKSDQPIIFFSFLPCWYLQWVHVTGKASVDQKLVLSLFTP